MKGYFLFITMVFLIITVVLVVFALSERDILGFGDISNKKLYRRYVNYALFASLMSLTTVLISMFVS